MDSQIPIQDEWTTSAPDPISDTAKDNFGISYLFPYQRLVISNILEAAAGLQSEAPSKQIVILPTGAGKSLCFMLPSLMLQGPTLVIFPLLSLISDQLRRCEDAGIGACRLVGGQSAAERRELFSGIAEGGIKIVLTNPETALSPGILPRLKECRFLHLVFDEVHTIPEWGDSFRPACLESRRIFVEAEIPIVTAFTATASDMVLGRVKEILFPDEHPHIVSANPDRPNISYTVLPSLCKNLSLELLLAGSGSGSGSGKSTHRLNNLEEYSPAKLVKRPVLIFCSSRRSAERTALEMRLRLNDNEIFFYHAGLSREEKTRIEKWFHCSTDGILSATIAFGMGQASYVKSILL
ncbi:MAG: DEAD/DEAH box helicase [Spirochaetales bacterium]|uniref:DEAD/DEAH box helicase n=1 Tax=Candidatus Thalassospirochaeta sargassi TaxID=3119039 RepID=A0AAJ1MNA9_9SPIO|nr:DEAD/DEAH box helicase [Spirochaetales bacterium]